ncbi:MAG: hypothetical protein GWP70_07075 [Proteobacteria bacterium]|nr:hypothetical protein [Pseudomonadota bacterium]
MNIYRIVATPLCLWLCLLLVVLGAVTLLWLPNRFELILLDGLWQPEGVRAAIADMDATQRVAHIWLTSTVDVVLPTAFGVSVLGSGLRLQPTWRKPISALVMLLIGFDLLEGTVQILALTNQVDWLAAKQLLTPVKLACYVVGLLLIVLGWLRWLVLDRGGAAS